LWWTRVGGAAASPVVKGTKDLREEVLDGGGLEGGGQGVSRVCQVTHLSLHSQLDGGGAVVEAVEGEGVFLANQAAAAAAANTAACIGSRGGGLQGWQCPGGSL
jgi:hypothetical protein